MRRRDFMTALGNAALAWPFAARAQQPAKVKRMALVHASEPVANLVGSGHPFYRMFFDELSHRGFAEGKNLIVERFSAEGQTDRFTQMVRDVVDARPDAIFNVEAAVAFWFKLTKTSIPIVTFAIDPVVTGLVPSIARPGGNITGTTIDVGFEIWGKRIGLLRELLPKLSNLCIMMAPMQQKYWEEGPYGSAIRQAARAAGITLTPALLYGRIDEAEYQRAFATCQQDRPDALLVNESAINFTNRVAIVGLAAKNRLPAMYTWRDFSEIGGLMSHAFVMEELARSTGYQMAQVLSGTNPGDIPFIQISRFELTLNLKTAKSLGIEFPATLLGSADFVVE
jgi:putative ABC transport system substrate-binding protein